MSVTTADNMSGNRKPLHLMTVMVVDIVDNMRFIVSAMLTEMGFSRVVSASNGAQAIQLLSVTSVDMVIAEAQLPKVDGIGLLQHVRANDLLAKIPFIMLSSSLEQSAVMKAIEQGVSDYVAKPFSARILRAKILRILGLSAKQLVTTENANTTPGRKSHQQSILVVDDAADNIQVISDILRQDYTVKAATSGETALKICAAEPQPDLVLLDIMMPGMDGFEVCRRLKANPDTQHITIIFLTAVNSSDNIVKGLELGAVDYITKPVNPPVVQARVRTHCKTVQDQKALREQLDALLQNSRSAQDSQQLTQQKPQQLMAALFDALAELRKTAAVDSPYLQAAQNASEKLSDLLVRTTQS